jgi:hypothetical protein
MQQRQPAVSPSPDKSFIFRHKNPDKFFVPEKCPLG